MKEFGDAAPDMKTQILDAIVARVTQPQKSAQADKGLKDEPVANRQERRMRVTKDWRIHYSYVPGPGIRFSLVGPHDSGLRQ